MPRTPEQAVAWGMARVGDYGWSRLCLSFVRQAFGLNYVGNWPNSSRNAGTAWDRAQHKHRTNDPTAIPRGVPVFWETPGEADHVALSLGDGWCLSNDFVKQGRIDRVRIADIARKWGPLVGWTEDLVGNRVTATPRVEKETAVALCPFARHKLIPAGSNDPAIRPRVAILHVDAGNAYDLHDYFKNRSGGIESHFHIAKDGVIFQYRETTRQADANRDANDFAVSIETQGLGSGEWTDEQIASIKRLLLWLHETHDIPLEQVDTWDGRGVGYHTLFGAPSRWTPVVKSCPGPDRKKQFHNVLVPWMRGNPTADERDEIDMASPDDLRKIVREELRELLGDSVVVPATESASYRKSAGNGKVLHTSAITRLMHGVASLRKSRNEDRALLEQIGEKVGLTPGE